MQGSSWLPPAESLLVQGPSGGSDKDQYTVYGEQGSGQGSGIAGDRSQAFLGCICFYLPQTRVHKWEKDQAS